MSYSRSFSLSVARRPAPNFRGAAPSRSLFAIYPSMPHSLSLSLAVRTCAQEKGSKSTRITRIPSQLYYMYICMYVCPFLLYTICIYLLDFLSLFVYLSIAFPLVLPYQNPTRRSLYRSRRISAIYTYAMVLQLGVSDRL